MLVQQDGDLQIAPNELVTVTVTAINTHYLAIFGDLLHAHWTIAQPLHSLAVPGAPTATAAQETRTFLAKSDPTEAFAISCDFVRNTLNQPNPGASYQIVLRGSASALVIQKEIFPIPPFPVVRPFLFEVKP